ncbi:hypothetical protein K488DRAFT_38514, partial [Vararia minispora EC-137]
VELVNVTGKEIDSLLSVIYPTDVQCRDLTSVEDWIAVLRLATSWRFTTCRQLALSVLDTRLDPPEKLALAHELGITDWVQPAWVSLCIRKEPLTVAEGERLPLADIIMIFTIRE